MLMMLVQILLLGQIAADAPAQPAPAQNPEQTVQVQAQVEPAPTTAPTSQPTQVTVNITTPAEAPADLVAELSKTRVGQMFQGKQVTLEEMMTLGFWVDNIRELVVMFLGFVPRIIVAILLFAIFWVIYRGVRKIVYASMKSANVDTSIRDMLASLIKWAILGFGLVIACNQIGVQIAALLTGVSIIGLAIGFAAQETLANFIAGIVIFWDKPFKIGDWIEVDGELGQVTRVTFRSTRLTNLDNDVVILPNTTMLSQRVINKSANEVTRATVPIGVAYKESLDRVRDVLLSMFEGDPRVVKHPEPIMEVRACGASSVDLMVHFWIREERYEDAMIWEYLEKAKKALDAAGVEIPFPHTQLLIEQTPAIDALAGRSVPTLRSA
jgi:small conductance mechanosensitive channel